MKDFKLAKTKAIEKWAKIAQTLKDTYYDARAPCGFCTEYGTSIECGDCPLPDTICNAQTHEGMVGDVVNPIELALSTANIMIKTLEDLGEKQDE